MSLELRVLASKVSESSIKPSSRTDPCNTLRSTLRGGCAKCWGGHPVGRGSTVLPWPPEGEVGTYKGEQESRVLQAQRG